MDEIRRGYLIKNFISEDVLKIFHRYSLTQAASKHTYSELTGECSTFYEKEIGHCIDIVANDSFANSLMWFCLPKISEIVGLKLSPVASFYRIYGPECKLPMHTDIADYEWSATINMGYEASECWPIYIENEPGVRYPFYLEKGDALLYQGAKYAHGREIFLGHWQTQLFLHYKEEKNEKDGQKDS